MYTRQAIESHPRISIKFFQNINGIDACRTLSELSADLGIALAAPILKKELFSSPKMGTINLHKGKLPNFRGMPPAFWELENGELEVGCTVHQVDSKLDTGEIILESVLRIDKYSTIWGMQARLHRCGVEMVNEAVKRLSSGSAILRQQPPGGKTYSRPPLALESRLQRKLDPKMPSGSIIKGIGKHTVFFLYSNAVMPLVHRWFGMRSEQRIVILLYHRVSDQFRDNVTIGIERFDQQMRFLANHWNVVSLKEIVAGNVPRNSARPIVAVSFDDGYLDNFENAAPILLKHQIPCTFFISTEKIAENKPFAHDLKALGFGLNNMNWRHVAQMHKWGFHFGSHTRNHVNLADVGYDEARDELSGSLSDIRTKLNQEQVFIAYPYGRKHHVTDQRIEMMKEIGYSACFSAYGGYNKMEMDLFNIKRVGINWAFDMTAFEARLNRWDRTE